jgi:hypothetical protein
MLELLGYASAILIGLSLGLLGAGGSILTVPVLVYFLRVPPVLATAYSLFVVGLTSLIGAMQNMKRGTVSFKAAAIFAVPAFTTVFLTRKYLVPAIPEQLLRVGGFALTKNMAIMVFFAALMLMASYSMLKNDREDSHEVIRVQQFNYVLIWLIGSVVGLLTGIVGIGGGFLIIPALVVLAKLPMKLAVGTSLLIIAANALIGFLGDVRQEHSMNWMFLFSFSAFPIFGIIIGSRLSTRIPGRKLKPAFGWFILALGAFILAKEIVGGFSH